MEFMSPQDWAHYVLESPLYIELLEDNPHLLNEIMKDYIDRTGDYEFNDLYEHFKN